MSPGSRGVSKFSQGTSARDIKRYVDYVLRHGTVTDRGIIGKVDRADGRAVGFDVEGTAVHGLEVIVRDGMIKTAFPVEVL